MRGPSPVCWLACLAVVILGGCGGTSHTKSTASSGARTTQAPVAMPAGPLGGAMAALQAAGFMAQSYNGSPADRPVPVARLQVTSASGPSVNVALYRTPADAANAAGQLRKALGSATANGEIQARGPRLYSTGQSTRLSTADRASFTKIVHTVEGA